MRCLAHLVLVMALVGGFAAWSLADESAAGPAVVIVSVGDADAGMMERVAGFCRDNTALPVRLQAMPDVEGDALDEIGRNVSEAIPGSDIIVVVVWKDIGVDNHGVFLPDSRVSVVNVKPVRPANGDAEVFGRRIERQAMQGVGMLLGLPACPNPQCVLWVYTALEDLDAKGRNFCPPCLDQVQKKGVERGMKLDAENPLIMD